MKRVKTLLLNTLILSGVSLLMRTVGMSFSVYLAGRIGPAGIGLYELVMSIYTLAISLAASGIRLSTTRLVVDARSRGSHSDRRIMALCIRYSLTLGLCAGLALFTLADFIAQAWLKTPEVALSLRILSLGLPFLSVSSCLNGYFTAIRKAAHFAATQVFEQLLRIGISFSALGYFLPLGSAYACVALVAGSCIAEVISTLAAYGLYRLEVRKTGLSGREPVLGKLLGIAVPDAVGSWVRSALVTAKNLLIPRSLQKTGASSQTALATYGTLQGMVLPVLTFPAIFLGALSGLLIPEVAESHTLGRRAHIRYIINRVIHLTALFSIGVAGALYLFAPLLGEALYPGKGTGRYIRLLAPVVPVMYLDMMVDGLLKGLGLQLASMRYNILDAGMSLSLVCLLIPRYGVAGYILTLYMSELLNFYLSIGKLISVADIRVEFQSSFLRPLAAIITTGLLVRGVALPYYSLSPGRMALAMAACLLLYAALLPALGCVGREDFRWLRGIFRR